jgi:large subunit ribosomal protein L24
VGDLVQVISGKDKGKRGKVTKILRDLDRVVVEGVNVVTRHVKPSQRGEGGRTQKEAPIHASNVMPVDGSSDAPTRVRIAAADEGKKKRVGKGGGEVKQG